MNGEVGALSEVALERDGLTKPGLLFGVVGTVLALDVITKLWVVSTLSLHQSVPVLGDVLRLTYTHNPGAAFGINVGEHSRIFFLVLALAALVVLALLYRSTPATDRVRLFAISLVAAGALGNILDRLRYERGVVDFIDVGIGGARWPIFNVADMAVTTGAILLLITFYMEGHDNEEEVSGADHDHS